MERFFLPLAGRDDRFWATSRLLCTITLNYNQMKCGSDHTSPYGARIFYSLSPYVLTCKPKVLHALEHSVLEPSCVLETMTNSCSLVGLFSSCPTITVHTSPQDLSPKPSPFHILHLPLLALHHSGITPQPHPQVLMLSLLTGLPHLSQSALLLTGFCSC